MTRQEMFDTVLTKLTAQGTRAMDPVSIPNTCAYLDPETGNRCAVGHLLTLPEDHPAYRRLCSVMKLADHYPQVEDMLDYYDNEMFIDDLQEAHDYDLGFSVSQFQDAMNKIANTYGLTYKEPIND